MGPWDGYHMYSNLGGMMILGAILMLLFWAAVIVLVFFAIRWVTRSKNNTHPTDYQPGRSETALDVLKGRYARGEITREEYQEMKRELES